MKATARYGEGSGGPSNALKNRTPPEASRLVQREENTIGGITNSPVGCRWAKQPYLEHAFPKPDFLSLDRLKMIG
jgi:hypothetical protein